MTDDPTITPSAFLQRRIAAKKRQATLKRNAAGYASMWPEAIAEVKQRFPGLTRAQRTALCNSVDWQIRLLCKRTGMSLSSFAPALASVAQLLKTP